MAFCGLWKNKLLLIISSLRLFFLFSWWSPAMLWHAIGFDGWLIVHQYLSGYRDLELADQFSILISTWISIASVIALSLLNPQFFFMVVRKLKVALNPMYIFSENPGKSCILPGNQILTMKNEAHWVHFWVVIFIAKIMGVSKILY